jgi:hypothetical protein
MYDESSSRTWFPGGFETAFSQVDHRKGCRQGPLNGRQLTAL